MDPNAAMHCINYQVLFETWGIKLTHDEVVETKISALRALKVIRKNMILKSIIKSERIIGREDGNLLERTLSIPEMATLSDKSLIDLRNLTISKVEWQGFIGSLSLTLTDGQSGTGGEEDLREWYTFDPTKKITKIETIID